MSIFSCFHSKKKQCSVRLLILVMLCMSYLASVVITARFHASSLNEGITESGLSANNVMDLPRPSTKIATNVTIPSIQKQNISLLLDKGIKKDFAPLDLVTRFGCGALQFETSVKRDSQQFSANDWKMRISAPCIWISHQKSRPPTDRYLFEGPPHCFSVSPAEQKADGWTLQSPTFAKSNTGSVCLSSSAGPRVDFLKRGSNFEHVGLWMLSSATRTHRLNCCFCSTDWLAKSRQTLLSVLGNSSEPLLVTKAKGYKQVQYIHDLLTSTFTVLSTQQESKQGIDVPSFWFGLQESIVAGSIPILVNSDENIGCNKMWLLDNEASPIITVSSWEDVIGTVKELLMESPQKWNERQGELRTWYFDTMATWAAFVESFLLKDSFRVSDSPQVLMRQTALAHIEELPEFLPHRKYEPLPRCLITPFYGRTNNKVVTIAKMLSLNQKDGRALGLDRPWSNWYLEHFDHRPDVLLFYYPHGECHETLEAEEAFGRPGWDLHVLTTLLPRKDFRDEAEAVIQKWPHGKKYISVHRRHFEGQCHLHARCSHVDLKKLVCLHERKNSESSCSTDTRLQACDMQLKYVHNPEKLPVVLFTDGQVPALDNTFVHRYNTTNFFVEMWLMTKSNIHYGNPQSTVDSVIYYWRRETGIEPKQCYGL